MLNCGHFKTLLFELVYPSAFYSTNTFDMSTFDELHPWNVTLITVSWQVLVSVDCQRTWCSTIRSILTAHCQWEDEMARERSGHKHHVLKTRSPTLRPQGGLSPKSYVIAIVVAKSRYPERSVTQLWTAIVSVESIRKEVFPVVTSNIFSVISSLVYICIFCDCFFC